MARLDAGMSEQGTYTRVFVGSTLLDHDADFKLEKESRSPAVALAPKRKAGRIPAFALSVTVAFSLIAMIFAGLSMHAPQVSAYSPHSPIVISSNSGFIAGNGVINGSGTITDPFIISGWEIDSGVAEGIKVENTNAYFVIRDVYIHGSGSYHGIHFSFVTHGSIVNCTLTTNLAGIRLDDSSYITITDSNLDDQSDSGIMLYYSRYVAIQNNSIDRDAYAIYGENGVRDVSVTANSMDDSDYGGLMITGQALRFSVVGNTMRSSTWGDGIDFETAPTNNYIADNNLSGNGGSGIWLNDVGFSNIIRNNTILDNQGGYGVHIALGDGNVIENNLVARNNDDGISLGPMVSVGQSYIANNTVEENYWGISCDLGSAYQILNNTVLGNSAGGISFAGNDATISGNTIVDNQDFGLMLAMSSPGNTITGNTFVNDGLFGIFVASENNVISSNTVNGRPLVFLDKVNGYSVPSAGQVVAKDCSNITVTGLNLSAATAGVELWNSVDCTVQGAALAGSLYGIYMENGSQRNHVFLCNISGNYIGAYISSESNQNFIERNTVNYNSYAGATVSSSYDNSLTTNDFVGDGVGFQITQCARTTIQGNFVKDTGLGVMIDSSTNVTIRQNDFLNAGAFGLYLYSASQCTIENNQINTIGRGVYMVWDSNSNLVRNNTIYQNNIGVYLSSFDPAHTCNWNNITGNTITDNTLDGIWLSYAQHNVISWNNVTGSGYGINVNATSTSSNWIYLNNFTGNSINAYSDCLANTNWWNTSTPISYSYGNKSWNGYLGNKYGDYSGTDSNGDGVGETPYTVGKETDHYPLTGMPMTIIPEFSGLALPIIALIMMLAIVYAASARARKQ